MSIPGWGPFPSAGSRDVLGRTWTCDEGTGIHEAGCLASNPANLSDAWELERVRTLSKGGESFTSSMTFYIRHAGAIYQVRYAPVAGGALGSPVSLRVRVERCLNASCSSVLLLGEPTLPYTVVSARGPSGRRPMGAF